MKALIWLLLLCAAVANAQPVIESLALFLDDPVPAAGGGSSSITNFDHLYFQPLTTSSSTANATSYATSSYQPTTNAAVFAAVQNSRTAAQPATTPTYSGNGLTWVLVTNIAYGTIATSTNMLSLFRAQGNPTSGAGTADFGGVTQAGAAIAVFEIQGADATAANAANAIVQIQLLASNVTANPHIEYTTTASPQTNAFIAVFGDTVNSASDFAPAPGWGEQVELAYATPNSGLTLVYQMNALPGTGMTNTATARTWAGILIEVKPSTTDYAAKPELVQSVSFGTNAGEDGNNFKIPFPNLTLAKNTLIATLTMKQTNTVTSWTDDGGNTWTKQADCYDNSTVLLATYCATNIAAGTKMLTIVFAGKEPIFHITAAEFAHIAPVSPMDVFSTNNAITGPLVQSGSMLTTTNGAMIYHTSVDIAGGSVSFGGTNNGGNSFGGNWLNMGTGVGSYQLYHVQRDRGSITPSFNVNQLAGDPYLSMSVAFKAATNGTLPTLTPRISSIYYVVAPGTASPIIPFPTRGTLQVVNSSAPTDTDLITTVTNDAGDVSRKLSTSVAHSPQQFYFTNATPRFNPPRRFGVNYNASGQLFVFYDIVGCTNVNTIGATAETTGTQSAANETVTNAPTITPTKANSVVISDIGYGIGPSFGITTTNQYTFYDTAYYSSETDASPLTFGDGHQHTFNLTTDLINFGYLSTNAAAVGGSGWNATGIEFKSP